MWLKDLLVQTMFLDRCRGCIPKLNMYIDLSPAFCLERRQRGHKASHSLEQVLYAHST